MDNKITKTSLLALGLSLLVSGCATAPKGPATPLPTSRTYSAPYDKVWGVVVAELSASHPVQSVDKASGLITTQLMSLGGGFGGWQSLQRFGYEPRGFLALATWTGGARCSLTVYVASSDTTDTTVRVTGRFEGFESNVSHSWQSWQSNGVLENQFLDKVEGIVGR